MRQALLQRLALRFKESTFAGGSVIVPRRRMREAVSFGERGGQPPAFFLLTNL